MSVSGGMAVFVAGTGIWSWQDLFGGGVGGWGGSVAGEFPVITELEAESLAWPPAGGYLNSPHGCMYLSHLRRPLSR